MHPAKGLPKILSINSLQQSTLPLKNDLHPVSLQNVFLTICLKSLTIIQNIVGANSTLTAIP